MTVAWYDYVGTSGVVLILVAYFLLQTERMAATSLGYSALNLLGALLITISLIYDFNLSAFIIEVFWIAISAYGVARWWQAHRNRRSSA